MHVQPSGIDRGDLENPPRRRAWEAPQVWTLPRLIRLTLQTGDSIPGGGSTGGGGSTVIP